MNDSICWPDFKTISPKDERTIRNYISGVKTHTFRPGQKVSRLPKGSSQSGWIYYIYDGDFLLYIGCSLNLRARMKSHHVYNNKIHTLVFMSCFGDLHRTEREHIKRELPELNGDRSGADAYSVVRFRFNSWSKGHMNQLREVWELPRPIGYF